MALRRTRALRFLDLVKSKSPPPAIRSSAAAPDHSPSLLRRILRRRPIAPPAPFSFPVAGDKLIEKMVRVSQMEAVRLRLSAITRSSISYSEFLRICREESNADETAAAIARSLDESVHVIAVGNLVFLRPREVVREIERVIPLEGSKNAQIMKELKEMETKKMEIDKKAAAGVRRELWCGLGFLLAQTVGFFRLTFWELSWDVMEPICFYVTCIYFMAGYTFFLKTSRDPSFESFFEFRFANKQKRFLRDSNFDFSRLNELKRQASFFSTFR